MIGSGTSIPSYAASRSLRSRVSRESPLALPSRLPFVKYDAIHRSSQVPYSRCHEACGDSAMAFWIGSFYWIKPENFVSALNCVRTRPQIFVSFSVLVRQLLGKYLDSEAIKLKHIFNSQILWLKQLNCLFEENVSYV